MDDDVKILRAEIKRLRTTLTELTPPLEALLKRRGFPIYRKNPSDDLLKPRQQFAVLFYENLKKYSFRLFLRDVIKHQHRFTVDHVTRFATRDVCNEYIELLEKAAIIERAGTGYRVRKRPVKSFGETLEWFIASLIREEYQAETLWGVTFRRPNVGGDYDIIAKIDSSFLYIEVKSSPPKQIHDREVSSFFDRVNDLAPLASVFFVDTELRMKDKIVPLFEHELVNRDLAGAPVERIVKELFHIQNKIFIINAKGGILANIGAVLRRLYH